MSLELLERDLRQAFAARLGELPPNAEKRVVAVDYRPRTRSRTALLTAGTAMAGTAAAAIVTAFPAIPTGLNDRPAQDGPGSGAASQPSPGSPVRTLNGDRIHLAGFGSESAGFTFTVPPALRAGLDRCSASPTLTRAERKSCLTLRFVAGPQSSAPPGARPLRIGDLKGWSLSRSDRVTVAVTFPSFSGAGHTIVATARRTGGKPSVQDLIDLLTSGLPGHPN